MNSLNELDFHFTVGASNVRPSDPSFESLEHAAYAFSREHATKGRRRYLRKLADHPAHDGFKVLWRLTCEGPNRPFVVDVPPGYKLPTKEDINVINDAMLATLEDGHGA